MLDKLNSQPVTRIWENRLARIEDRIAKSEESHEQRILILRDAMSDFVADFITNKVAPLHDEIISLKKSNAQLKKQLEEKSTLDQRVEDVMKRLDARQIARDEAKRGKMGPQGQRGARGERGPPGARGPAGRPASDQAITAFKLDVEHWRVVSYLANGRPGPIIDLHPFLKRYDNETSGG